MTEKENTLSGWCESGAYHHTTDNITYKEVITNEN